MISGVKKPQVQHGFTLIEVMVAVAIVALAVSALLFSVGKQVDSSSYLREKILGQWVALNILQEAQLKARATDEFPDDNDSGDVKFANQQWRWEIESAKTDNKNFVRLDVRVFTEEGNSDDTPIATATGYIDKYFKLKRISNRSDGLNNTDDSDDETTGEDSITDETVDDNEASPEEENDITTDVDESNPI